jgi:hypothetical protein
MAVDEDEHPFTEGLPTGKQFSTIDQEVIIEEKPERRREKRSMVVDDLASRIRSSALTTCI